MFDPRELDVARHALGLPNKRNKSYRNHFVTGPGSIDYVIWTGMVEKGYAIRRSGGQLTGGDDIFRLVTDGAKAALQLKERLDREDFPDA